MPRPEARTALQSVTRRGFLVSRWPWRAVGYLLTGVPVVGAAFLLLAVPALPLVLSARMVLSGEPRSLATAGFLAALGVVLVATLGPLAAAPLAHLERWRLRMVDARPVETGRGRTPRRGAWSWLRARYTEPTSWRELGYACLLATVVPAAYGVVVLVLVFVVAAVTSPFLTAGDGQPVSLVVTISSPAQAVPFAVAGVLLLPGIPYLLTMVAGVHGMLGRALLAAPGERLRAELVEVSRSRARLVDAFDAERRRIERDLHDGAQRRLVGLTLKLGVALLDLPPDSAERRAVAEAHGQAKLLMGELRELIRGIHPQVLTDRGLSAAVGELADQSPVPVTVHADLPRRPPASVEAMVYFVVAEALTNVAKHSGATHAQVDLRMSSDVVTVEVGDDGRGGASPERGSGLTGLADRVAVAGGRMFVSSPTGGPTVIRVEVPCQANLVSPA